MARPRLLWILLPPLVSLIQAAEAQGGAVCHDDLRPEIELRTDPLSGWTTVTAAGDWPYVSDVRAEVFATPTAAADLRLELTGGLCCLPASVPYEETVPLPPLAPGQHSLAVVLVGLLPGEPSIVIDCGSVPFSIPEPIPTLAPSMAGLLVVLFLGSGWWMIRIRRRGG